MRVSRAALATCSSVNPGSMARRIGSTSGMAMITSAVTPIARGRTTAQKARQASSSSPAANRRVRIGMSVMAM